MHIRNKHNGLYDFTALVQSYPNLESFVIEKHGRKTIDFSKSESVKALNTALLFHFYGISSWDIPNQYLCPPIPGRADFIHHVADILGCSENGCGEKGIKILDIGVGANCIFPLLGNKEYGWEFVATEIDYPAFKSAKSIVKKNHLEQDIQFRFQKNKDTIFRGIIQESDYFDMTICNPPFHASEKEAQKATKRKWKNLGINHKASERNFGGKTAELWCEGGEKAFIKKMIYESQNFGEQCKWFSTLVSKKSNLQSIYQYLKTVNTKKIKTVEMNQGQKQSRIVFWSFY